MKSKGRILVKQVNRGQGSRAWGDSFWKIRHLRQKENMVVMKMNEKWRKDSLNQEEIRFTALRYPQFFKEKILLCTDTDLILYLWGSSDDWKP